MYHEYSENEKEILVNRITQSIKRLIEKDHELLYPEKIETDHLIWGEKEINREVHETAINHRLAVNLEMFLKETGFPDYHVDIEYNRYINQKKLVQSIKTGNMIEVRPDILVHTRTNFNAQVPHFLVVEAKKFKHNEKDRNHIKDIMCDPNYRYKYGLLVSYYQNLKAIECGLLTLKDGIFNVTKFSIDK